MRFYGGYHPVADYLGPEGAESPMDSEFYGPTTGEALGFGIKDIGMSVPMGISASNVSGIYAKIRAGAGNIEIGFPGLYSGNRQGHTPGMYGEDQRQAIREIAKVNEVKLTTHAPYPIMGMMGRDPRDNFSLSNAYQNLTEIQRSIDFAADTAGGGSVVVHTGEWERPMTEMTLDDPTWKKNLSYDESGRLLFRKRQEELHDANFVLLDDRTSQKMETVQKDRTVSVPKWKRAEESGWGYYQDEKAVHITDEKKEGWMKNHLGKKVWVEKGDYVDYEGKKIINPYDPKYGRVPEFDRESNRFKVEYKTWDGFKEEAKEQSAFRRKHWLEMTGKKPEDDDFFYYKGVVYPDEAFLHATLETNEGHSRGWALQYGERTQYHLDRISGLKEARVFYEKLMGNTPKEKQWKLFKQDRKMSSRTSDDFIPPTSRDPVDLIDDALKEERVNLEFSRQASTSQQQQAEDTAETKEHIVTPVKRFKKQIARNYAEAGIRAFQRSKDPENPLTLAIENLFPDRFGGHPQELQFVIDEARKWFVKFLTEKEIFYGVQNIGHDTYEKSGKGPSQYYTPGLSKEEAAKIAETHIKATLDTGHLNLWRKHWQPKIGQSIDETNKDFNKWYLKEVEKLAKKGYIGNVHLTDNYGFQDDHIAPGQGNVPIKEVMRILRKNGYDKAITVEPGADASTDLSDFHGLMKTWRMLGSPIYGIGGGSAGGTGAPGTWADVQHSYFGQNRPPNYVFGAYSPSNDWTLWSQVPME